MHLPYLLLFIYTWVVSAEVIPVESIDQFYDLANNDEGTYTVVKYYTQWCSHCKKLKGVYDELEQSLDLNNVQFLEVDCDPFGSSICKRLPGYPIVEVIKPRRNNNISEIVDVHQDQSIWERVKQYLWFSNGDKWTLEESRVMRFEGNRNLKPLQGFIRTVVEKDMLTNELLSIIDGTSDTKDPDLLKAQQYYNEKLKYSHNFYNERSRLEKILKTNKDSSNPELHAIKLQLELLNIVETQMDDEL